MSNYAGQFTWNRCVWSKPTRYHAKLILYHLTAPIDGLFNNEIVITITNNLIGNKCTAHTVCTFSRVKKNSTSFSE